MRIERALSLRNGSLVVAGKETMRVISMPESSVWDGRPVARVTVADTYHRTRIFTHEEIEQFRDEAA